MFQTIQRSSCLCASSNIAGVLVLQANRQTVTRCLVRKFAEFPHHVLKTRFRLDGSPEREYPDYTCSQSLGDEERTLGQPWLVFERVLRCENIVLKPAVHWRRIRQQTLEQR